MALYLAPPPRARTARTARTGRRPPRPVLPGQAAVTEDPTFPGALDALHRTGARLVGVPPDDVERLADTVRAHAPGLVYLIPTHQNPVGTVLPTAARHKLAELVARHPDVTFADDMALAEVPLTDAAAPAAGRPVTAPAEHRDRRLPAQGVRLAFTAPPDVLTTAAGTLAEVAAAGLTNDGEERPRAPPLRKAGLQRAHADDCPRAAAIRRGDEPVAHLWPRPKIEMHPHGD